MSPNQYKPHILVLPEDDANRQIANGFIQSPNLNAQSFEEIGDVLAQDCSDNTNELWGHELLKHNKTELERMILSVKPFLFN
jgi:hypothetical protein